MKLESLVGKCGGWEIDGAHLITCKTNKEGKLSFLSYLVHPIIYLEFRVPGVGIPGISGNRFIDSWYYVSQILNEDNGQLNSKFKLVKVLTFRISL